MRLIVTEARVQLEPETPAEMAALEASAARGEWTNGRGLEAIATLGALAVRLAYPVGATMCRVPPRLVVVQRGEHPLYARLTAMTRGDAMVVVWDRRHHERRTSDRPAPVDQRRPSRRQPPPATWPVLRFLVARPRDASPGT